MILLSLAFIIIYGFIHLTNHNYYRLVASLISIIVIFLPNIIAKLFKYKLPYEFQLIYLIFIFWAQILGSIADLYNTISWYDNVMHFISGILDSMLAIYIFNRLVRYNQYNIRFITIFSISFTAAIGVFWEIYEYTVSKITGMDLQNVITSGVNDTMWDLILAIVGSFIFTYIYKLILRNEPFKASF